MPKDGPRLELLDAVRVVVEKAIRDGKVIAVAFEASRLFRDHPFARISLAEIKAELECLAVARGVAILGKTT
jgi:hypothetical protein